MSTIANRFSHQNQSHYLDRIVKVGKRKIRIHIRRNAYDHQSYAETSIWTDVGWRKVVYVRADNFPENVSGVSYTRPLNDFDQVAFGRFAEQILKETLQVVA